MINNIEIGKRIKEIRNDKKLNQREFAKRLTLSQNHISYLEKGIRKITEKFINDLCKEYNVNKEWLLTGTGEKYIDMIEGLNIDDEHDLVEDRASHQQNRVEEAHIGVGVRPVWLHDGGDVGLRNEHDDDGAQGDQDATANVLLGLAGFLGERGHAVEA